MVNPEHAYHQVHPSDREISHLKNRLRTVYLALKLACHGNNDLVIEKVKEAELMLDPSLWELEKKTPG